MELLALAMRSYCKPLECDAAWLDESNHQHQDRSDDLDLKVLELPKSAHKFGEPTGVSLRVCHMRDHDELDDISYECIAR